MRTQTVINTEDNREITTLDGALMPPVGTRIVVKSRGYVVTEAPEMHIEQSADEHNAGSVTIQVRVKEA